MSCSEHQGGDQPGGLAALDGEKPDLYLGCRAIIGLLRDAAAVVPEIARLAEPIIGRAPRGRRRQRRTASHAKRCADAVVKFPIGRVVRFNKLIYPLDYTPTIKELDQAGRSLERAITSLQRQKASVMTQLRHRLRNMTDDEREAGWARARVTDAGYWPVDGEWP